MIDFEKGKLYQVVEDTHLKGCVIEFFGKGEFGELLFSVIKGNDNYVDFHDFLRLSKNYFDHDNEVIPLIPTKDDVHECEPCPENGYDEINKSFHYNQGIEAIEYIESHNMNFNEGNVIKYVTRAKYKGTYIKDLEKARYYLDRLIAKGQNDED